MDAILGNRVISEFLSEFPLEKHVNCLLGVVLLGIYNLRTFSLDFRTILAQIEARQPYSLAEFAELPIMSASQLPLASISKISEDTPRFLNAPKVNAFASQPLLERPRGFFHKNKRIVNKPFKQEKSRHSKTPSLVNKEVKPQSQENSEILKIADQFLNGRFVNEYCKGSNSGEMINTEFQPVQRSKSRDRLQEKTQNQDCRRSSLTSSKKSTLGPRNSSYSKFW